MARDLILPEDYRRDTATLELVDEAGLCRCPECETPFFDWGPCEHIVTTFAYNGMDEGGWWAWDYQDSLRPSDAEASAILGLFGDTAVIERLPEAVERIVWALQDLGEEAIARAIGRLRTKRLRSLVADSLRESCFDRSAGQAYLTSILRRSPTYSGWMTMTTTGMCSSSFDVHYDGDSIASADRVRATYARDLATLDRLAVGRPGV